MYVLCVGDQTQGFEHTGQTLCPTDSPAQTHHCFLTVKTKQTGVSVGSPLSPGILSTVREPQQLPLRHQPFTDVCIRHSTEALLRAGAV